MTTPSIPPVLDAPLLEELLRERSDVRLLDVRTPGEFEAVHIRGAYNVPLDTLGEHAAEIHATVREPVVLICQSGNRARRAEEALKSAGMPNLHVLDGGVSGWVAAGRPVQRGRPRVSLERQVRVLAGGLAAAGGLLALAVSPWFGLLAAGVGGGLVLAGLTDSCAMAMVLARLPYNRPAGCDVEAMVRALRAGAAPGAAADRPARASRSCC
jgi:rhodanese-related sulfurtransferase